MSYCDHCRRNPCIWPRCEELARFKRGWRIHVRASLKAPLAPPPGWRTYQFVIGRTRSEHTDRLVLGYVELPEERLNG